MMVSWEVSVQSSDESQVITADLIGVPHADVALVLARYVAVDWINIFRADQLIHWNVSIHTHIHTQQ